MYSSPMTIAISNESASVFARGYAYSRKITFMGFDDKGIYCSRKPPLDAGISATKCSHRPAFEQILRIVDKINRFYRRFGGLLTTVPIPLMLVLSLCQTAPPAAPCPSRSSGTYPR